MSYVRAEEGGGERKAEVLEGAFVHTASEGSSISAHGRSFRDEIYSGRKNRDSEMRERSCVRARARARCMCECEHGDALMFPALDRLSLLCTMDSLGHGKLADRYEIRFDQSRSAEARPLFAPGTMTL